MNFRAPIVGAPIGPKSSRASKTQRFKFEKADGGSCEDCVLLFDTSTRMEDIPYGDYFTVEEHWRIESVGSVGSRSTSDRRSRDDANDADGGAVSDSANDMDGVTVAVAMAIRFSKSTMWRAAIESR
jgi:hypothetical protein